MNQFAMTADKGMNQFAMPADKRFGKIEGRLEALEKHKQEQHEEQIDEVSKAQPSPPLKSQRCDYLNLQV